MPQNNLPSERSPSRDGRRISGQSRARAALSQVKGRLIFAIDATMSGNHLGSRGGDSDGYVRRG